jgi:phosphohistidine phosphatase
MIKGHIMNLYLVRHAIAEDTAASGRDADRALTADGKAKMRRAAEGLRASGVRLDVILTSPFRRAVETAEIVARVVGGTETRVLAELAAGADVAAVLSALRPYRHVEELALVGHQPDLGLLSSQVMTGSPATCPLGFKKGGVACFEIPAPRGALRGELVWLMTPKQLRSLGEG